MSSPNASLTFIGRKSFIQRVLELGYTVAHASESMGVSRATGHKWIRRFKEEGWPAFRIAQASRICLPRATSAEKVAATCELRRRSGRGPLHLSLELGMPASNVHAVLRRERLNRVDSSTAPPGKSSATSMTGRAPSST